MMKLIKQSHNALGENLFHSVIKYSIGPFTQISVLRQSFKTISWHLLQCTHEQVKNVSTVQCMSSFSCWTNCFLLFLAFVWMFRAMFSVVQTEAAALTEDNKGVSLVSFENLWNNPFSHGLLCHIRNHYQSFCASFSRHEF